MKRTLAWSLKRIFAFRNVYLASILLLFQNKRKGAKYETKRNRMQIPRENSFVYIPFIPYRINLHVTRKGSICIMPTTTDHQLYKHQTFSRLKYLFFLFRYVTTFVISNEFYHVYSSIISED